MAPPEEPADRASPPSGLGRAMAVVRETINSRPRALVGIVVAGAVLLAGTMAAAQLLHPDLAQMPPVMRRPAIAATPPSPAASTAPLVASASPPLRPTPPRSRRPSPSRSARPPSPPPLLLSFEAEAAQRSSQPRERKLATASGGRIVGFIGRYDEYLRFTRIAVPTAGRYTVTIFYASAEARYADLRINGGPRLRVSFASTGSWDRVGSRTVQITLAAGQNTIELWNVNPTYAPDIDRLTITR